MLQSLRLTLQHDYAHETFVRGRVSRIDSLSFELNTKVFAVSVQSLVDVGVLSFERDAPFPELALQIVEGDQSGTHAGFRGGQADGRTGED